ncbi:MAG: bifunctional diaminohydroxyphosphoribosylaminopyrimidine deaminase/5-amino-6-(5-phosphoribosylamino)uracil reductase RibD [Gammaproteobacteria bacterium]|nr:bifunctional diaminohydroxyphosphoribosylaminopyrimidine deaminase/5-amino-6-(5-phosphoribosylamino)uracil reductase RibD [Gammaproteobacteria bacterium]
MTSSIEYMQHAIRLAKKGLYTTDPNPAVGCVVVKHNEIVGEGWHQVAGQAHAEVLALKQAGLAAQGAIVFVTLEPCCHTGKTPPCADALINAGVKKVVIAMKDPNPLVAGKGLKKLQDAGIVVETGLLETQARALNPGFIKRMEQGRPYVRIKLAMSLDGRTAMASGESKWISSEASRFDVQRLRAASSAILTGIETVLTDDPSMNVRISADELSLDVCDGPLRQPKRIVLDSKFRIPKAVKISSLDGECIVYTTMHVDNKDDYPFIIEDGCTQGSGQDARIDLSLLMQNLAEKEINLLHVEAGSVLCGALLKNGLVDEIIIYMAPHVMGDKAKGLFHLPELEMMKDRISLTINDVRMIGNDIRISAKPVHIN